MKPLLCGGLDAEDAQQLLFEVLRGIPESASEREMNPQVRAFRARLVAEIEAKSGIVELTLDFPAPPR
jgi:hypothetical protein